MEQTTMSFEMGTDGVKDDTMREMLARSIGKYVVCELLIGSRGMTVREGILTEVGRSYFVLQDEATGAKTGCDLYSLKFVTSPGEPPHGVQSGYGRTGSAYGCPRMQGAAGCDCTRPPACAYYRVD